MWWTIEQVAEHTGLTVHQVNESRRRREWPGSVGVRQGRRVRYDPELVKAGPTEPQRTDDAAVAAVWLLEDIRNLMRACVQELQSWHAEQAAVDATLADTATTISDWAEWPDERADDDDR